MPKIGALIERFFPGGTLNSRSWDKTPHWPPDVFALTATLANMSGCYSRTAFADQWLPGCYFDKAYRDRVEEAGTSWTTGMVPPRVKHLWRVIWAARGEDVLAPRAAWWNECIELMSIADQASAGMGFAAPKERSLCADFVLKQHRALTRNRRVELSVPKSLCRLVPTSEVCVQPKTRTPQVGCTLRSLTHNLALLPQEGEIRTKWLLVPRERRNEGETFNILLFPFPFQIDGKCFYAEPPSDKAPARFFGLRQNWLKPPSAHQLLEMLKGLIECAKHEVEKVHGLILPETALDAREIQRIGAKLARDTDLEIFISGAYGSESAREEDSGNRVYMFVFYEHEILNFWPQAKHHRWRLDGDQIRRYHLGDALNPQAVWWEKIALPPRECAFYVFRNGASLAALVCEDLARIDPVQAALRAIGPNLVTVLLMDGPQLERRWPGRYATVLADDPGSAVLTLSSIGMVSRAAMPGGKEYREIALWKEPGGAAKELWLPRGCHGLLLSLSTSWETNFTLDGRSDGGATMQLSLAGLRPIRHPAPTAWLDENP